MTNEIIQKSKLQAPITKSMKASWKLIKNYFYGMWWKNVLPGYGSSCVGICRLRKHFKLAKFQIFCRPMATQNCFEIRRLKQLAKLTRNWALRPYCFCIYLTEWKCSFKKNFRNLKVYCSRAPKDTTAIID